MNTFKMKTEIYFGENSLEKLIGLDFRKAFIVTDPFMIQSKMIDCVLEKLEKGGTEYHIFDDVVVDPPLEIITKGIEEFMNSDCDVVIALGGGSSIDTAKAIKEFSRKILKINEIKLIAIPTTSGTGSEVTSFSVITDREKNVKYPLVKDELLPNIAILDSNLVKSVPNFITADTGMDVLTHALEAYVSRSATDFSDALSEKAISLIFEYLLRAYKNGEDSEAREKIHNASCLAGIAFNSASLGLNHGIAHALGATFKIPHGRCNSILLPHIIKYNADIKGYSQNEYTLAAKKYFKISKMLNLSSNNVRNGVNSLINAIKKLQNDMGMKTKLSDVFVSNEDLKEEELKIANKAINDGCTSTNPRKTCVEDIIKILRNSY